MAIASFTAETANFFGKVDLSWTLTEPLGPNEEIRIRRQESIFPLSNEGVQVFSTQDSDILSFTDENLPPDVFYYYSIFIFNTVSLEYSELGPSTRSKALAYRKWGEGERLFRQLPVGIQDNDTATRQDGTLIRGANLQKIVDVIGNHGDYFRSIVNAMGYFRRPDLVAEQLLDFYSEMFGFPPERGFDLRVLRNLAQGLVAVYKIKGTCQGLINFVKIFTAWDSICNDTLDLTFKLWDGESKRHFSWYTGVAVDQVFETGANFPIDIWTNGKFVDSEDDPFYKILGNDDDSISFLNKTPPFERLSSNGIGISADQFQDLSQTWDDDEWLGYRLFIDSFSTTEYYVVIGNNANTLFLNRLYTNFGTPERFQEVPINTIAPGSTAYRLEPEYYVQTGRHSLLYDNTVPVGFRGLAKDPAHFLFGGSRSILQLGQFSERAVIITIESVAWAVGRSTGLTATTLTDTDADFGAPNSQVGRRLNPNVLQAQDFEIISNTQTSVTVSGNLLAVAASGNNYSILDELDAVKAKRLREVLPDFAPFYSEIFIFFEPRV